MMSSRETTAGYDEIVRRLLAPARQARTVNLEPSEEQSPTFAQAGEDDRGMFRSARGIIFAMLLGAALWGLVIGGVLIAAAR